MRWADWILALFLPQLPQSRRRRSQLEVQPLERRDVPSSPDTLAIPAGSQVTTSTTVTNPRPPLREFDGRVWKDVNGDGLQEPGEPGVGFVALQLFQGDTLVGTTVADAIGNYAFNSWNVTNGTASTSDDGLQANTAYQIRIAGDQTALVGLRPTLSRQGADAERQRDSDITASGTGAVLDFTTTNAEAYRHNDAGYAPAATLGNLVWKDANNNGKFDKGEKGIPGVTVRLLDAAGATQVATTTTGADGTYLFTGLLLGSYIIEVSAANFTSGSALAGYASSTGRPGQAGGTFEGSTVADPNQVSLDGTDHGSTADGVVRSKPVTLGTGAMDNRSIDFGFFQGSSLSGRVFFDVNGNGRIDPEDKTGLVGVRIQAAGPAGVFTALTDSTGHYQFENLPAGNYIVTKTPPAGYKSSTPNLMTTTIAPATPVVCDFGEKAAVDLQVTQAVSSRSVRVGGFITLTYHVKNLGALTASGLTLKTSLPAGLRYVSSTGTGTTYDPATHQATISSLAPGAEIIVEVRLQAVRKGSVVLRASVQGSQSEEHMANNVAATTVSVRSTIAPPPKSKTSGWLFSSGHG
jgi:uncharacterized repeat protein (TIGR01451 family)